MTTAAVNYSIFVILLLSMLASVILPTAANAEEVWHNASEFDVEGKGWQDTETFFDRLPAHAKGKAPESVWSLSKDSAGIAVRFQTDASAITVRWTLNNSNLAMPHMPATGVSGVDLYQKEAVGGWRFIGNGRPESQKENRATFHSSSTSGKPQQYLLYLPLYNGVQSVEIAVPTGAQIAKAEPRPAARNRPVVFYGTSITQGGCASRPGMAHVAILGRKLDWPVINLGFSGSGRMEPEMANLVAELDPAVFVIDCLANMGDLSETELSARITNLARTVRKSHPQTPILFVGQANVNGKTHRTSEIQAKAVKGLIAEGVGHLSLLGGEKLLGKDGEGTVDGVHPNDLGMMRQADAFYPALESLLSKISSQTAAGTAK